MDQGKKGTKSNLTCDVCKIDFNSNADYALHEFSKKHCDNLIRLAKQKPIVSKQKAKNEAPPVEKEQPKINLVTHTGSFAKYGYFIPGEIYANAETSKEFNTDYDPYLQKFAENPYKEKPLMPIAVQTSEQSAFSSVGGFTKKKKKKVKTCQVCNVTLLTVPEYEAHMKSLQHIWKLKVTGMGVSAHFVRASSDLHTTDINEEPKVNCQTEQQIPVSVTQTVAETTTTTSSEDAPSGPFPLLYCSDCELLLNSPQQYNAHINGKLHIECAQRKAELKAKKEKLENPSPNQLYCYSCKISLNNLFQYNEHKNGKKHKTKCRNLVRKGITIPPEERVPGIPLPNPNKPVVYPELYEKLVLEKQKEGESEPGISQKNDASDTTSNIAGVSECDDCSGDEKTKTDLPDDGESSSVVTDSQCDSVNLPKIVFHKNSGTPQSDSINPQMEVLTESSASEVGGLNKQITILADNTPVQCSICDESFQWQSQLDMHLSAEDHLKKILEHKLNGRTESDILNKLFSDRNVIKPNNLGQLTCSICNVTADNSVEFEQHLNSIVHKYTEKDYKMKRTLEVKHIVANNEENVYFCKLCKEGWLSLVDYTQHLHFVKHKSIQRAQRAKAVMAKRKSIQKPRLGLKKRNAPLKRVTTGKNPGVRTKISGVAVDLNSGTQAPIPNLEPLEPKIDTMKNVSIGATGKLTEEKTNAKAPPKKRSEVRSQRKAVSNQRKGPYRDRPPFVPSGNMIPPLMSRPPFQPRFPRPGYCPPNRNWVPFSSPPSMFRPFCERPAMGNPYPRPPWFQRPPWPRFR